MEKKPLKGCSSVVYDVQLLYTQPFNGPFVRDYPGEPVPEETFTHTPMTKKRKYLQVHKHKLKYTDRSTI